MNVSDSTATRCTSSDSLSARTMITSSPPSSATMARVSSVNGASLDNATDAALFARIVVLASWYPNETVLASHSNDWMGQLKPLLRNNQDGEAQLDSFGSLLGMT